MKHYTILNEMSGKRLTLPRTGLWYTTRLEEARSMQEAAKEYLRSLGLRRHTQYIQVLDIDSNEVVY